MKPHHIIITIITVNLDDDDEEDFERTDGGSSIFKIVSAFQ